MGEYSLELEDRLYTSTEVAKILGVSLRSVYRYLEDDKLIAEMKTATGRHRFTKQNILDFLYPQRRKDAEKVEEKEDESPESPTEEVSFERGTEVELEVEEDEEEDEEEEEETDEIEVEGGDEEVEVGDEVGDENDEEESGEADDDTAEEEDEEEEVDWLSKFRKAAEKYKAETEKEEDEEVEVEEKKVKEKSKKKEPDANDKEEVSGLTSEQVEEESEEEEEEQTAKDSNKYYYTSEAGGLKDVAQKLDKSAKKASLDYAFTMHAGMSLHKPINPFSLIHSYVRSEDLPFFEKILGLKEEDEDTAQLCLIVSDEDEIYEGVVEMHGLNVVEDGRLANDLKSIGEEDLASDL